MDDGEPVGGGGGGGGGTLGRRGRGEWRKGGLVITRRKEVFGTYHLQSLG